MATVAATDPTHNSNCRSSTQNAQQTQPRPAAQYLHWYSLPAGSTRATWARGWRGCCARRRRIWSALGYHLRIIKERGRDAA